MPNTLKILTIAISYPLSGLLGYAILNLYDRFSPLYKFRLQLKSICGGWITLVGVVFLLIGLINNQK